MMVFLPQRLWDRLNFGKPDAVKEVSELLNGVRLYDHVFVPPGEWEEVACVSIEELVARGVIKSVTLHAGVD